MIQLTEGREHFESIERRLCGRFDLFAAVSANGRYLRTADGRNRYRSVARSVQKLWSGLAL